MLWSCLPRCDSRLRIQMWKSRYCRMKSPTLTKMEGHDHVECNKESFYSGACMYLFSCLYFLEAEALSSCLCLYSPPCHLSDAYPGIVQYTNLYWKRLTRTNKHTVSENGSQGQQLHSNDGSMLGHAKLYAAVIHGVESLFRWTSCLTKVKKQSRMMKLPRLSAVAEENETNSKDKGGERNYRRRGK